jgi:hypothetical protein
MSGESKEWAAISAPPNLLPESAHQHRLHRIVTESVRHPRPDRHRVRLIDAVEKTEPTSVNVLSDIPTAALANHSSCRRAGAVHSCGHVCHDMTSAMVMSFSVVSGTPPFAPGGSLVASARWRGISLQAIDPAHRKWCPRHMAGNAAIFSHPDFAQATNETHTGVVTGIGVTKHQQRVIWMTCGVQHAGGVGDRLHGHRNNLSIFEENIVPAPTSWCQEDFKSRRNNDGVRRWRRWCRRSCAASSRSSIRVFPNYSVFQI